MSFSAGYETLDANYDHYEASIEGYEGVDVAANVDFEGDNYYDTSTDFVVENEE